MRMLKKVKSSTVNKIILLVVLLFVLCVMNKSRMVSYSLNYRVEHFANKELKKYREPGYSQMELVDHVDEIHSRLFEIVINNYEIFQFEIDKIKKYTKKQI